MKKRRLQYAALAFFLVWFFIFGGWLCSEHPVQRGQGLVAAWAIGWIISVAAAVGTYICPYLDVED